MKKNQHNKDGKQHGYLEENYPDQIGYISGLENDLRSRI